MAKTTKQLYRFYKKKGGKSTFSKFRKVCKAFNSTLMRYIIEGYHFDMGHYLSRMGIIRIERNFDNPQVNWGATMKNKKEILNQDEINEADLYSKDNKDGIKYFIYHTDEWYCRFYWQKKNCRIPNKTAYAFRATRGKKGNKTKLKKRLNENDLSYLDYRLVSN